MNFNSVPSSFRLPFFSTEFNAVGSQIATEQNSVLLVGQILAGGTATPNVPVQIVDPNLLDGLFGAGSMLAWMGKVALKVNPFLPIFALPVVDNPAGAAASGSLVVTGPSTVAGTLALYIGGVGYDVAVPLGAIASAIATAIVAAFSADPECFVTAAVDGANPAKVNLTAKHKGLVYNSLDVRINYNSDDVTPAGVAIAITAMSGGTANPSLTAAIAGMGEVQYNEIAFPYTDATSLGAIEAELEDRWGAIRQIDGKAFAAAAGSFGTVTALGQTRNSKQDSILATQNSPTPVFVIAANEAVAIAGSAQQDPALPLQTVPLTHVLAPALADQWTLQERNLALYDGISTFKVVKGAVVLERVISTYQTNAAGAVDTSYLSMEKLLTLSDLRFEYNDMWATKYPRYKLGQDSTKYGPGQLIMTPKLAKSEIVHLWDDWLKRGLVQGDVATFSAALVVEINSANPDRLDVALRPQLMGQLRMVGSQIDFLT